MYTATWICYKLSFNLCAGKSGVVHGSCVPSKHLSVSPIFDPVLQIFLKSELSLLMKFELNFM